jgi:hypothetical protein
MQSELQRIIKALKQEMTQYKIAKETGLNWTSIRLWESGKITNIRPENLEKLRNLLKQNKMIAKKRILAG